MVFVCVESVSSGQEYTHQSHCGHTLVLLAPRYHNHHSSWAYSLFLSNTKHKHRTGCRREQRLLISTSSLKGTSAQFTSYRCNRPATASRAPCYPRETNNQEAWAMRRRCRPQASTLPPHRAMAKTIAATVYWACKLALQLRRRAWCRSLTLLSWPTTFPCV